MDVLDVSPDAQVRSDRLQPYVIGLLGLSALVDLALSDSGSRGGFLLAVFALLGWTQDRVRLRVATHADGS